MNKQTVMNESIKNLLDRDNFKPSHIKNIEALIREYKFQKVELTKLNDSLYESLSDLEVEIQFLNQDVHKELDLLSNKETINTIDDLEKDLLDCHSSHIDRASFYMDHVNHVGEVVVMIRHLINKNKFSLLEVEDMIKFLEKKKMDYNPNLIIK